MRVSKEFSKFAKEYDRYNIIQNEVAQKLIEPLSFNKEDIVVDLGCGSGTISKLIATEVKALYALDFAEGMLACHPKGGNITCSYADFNSPLLFEALEGTKIDIIISSSALQWAKDLERTFSYIAEQKSKVALSLFTCNTFETLYKVASLPRLLRCADEIELYATKYFEKPKFELVSYKLHFESVREMFRYIKRSGVSGARNLLSYKEMKRVMQNYPHNYLEFEVLFIWA